MSVEEARAGVEGRLYSRLEFNLPPSEDDRIAIDRLILEVQAAMPCEWDAIEIGSAAPTDPGGPCKQISEYWCPSCSARAQLATV